MFNKKKIGLTEPNFITKYYFNFIYSEIIKIIKISKKKKILDFGCGQGYLKKKIDQKNIKVINYDIIDQFSEIRNWKKCNFDLVVFSQVLMYLDKKKVESIFKYLLNKKSEIIVVFSNQTLLNKIASYILGHSTAYVGTKLFPYEEEGLLINYFKVKVVKNFYLFKVYYLST